MIPRPMLNNMVIFEVTHGVQEQLRYSMGITYGFMAPSRSSGVMKTQRTVSAMAGNHVVMGVASRPVASISRCTSRGKHGMRRVCPNKCF